MKRWVLALLIGATPAFAESIPYRQSLLQNGAKASAFGEVAVQRDALADFKLTSARLQGGWLLSKSSYFSTTIGAVYTGLGARMEKSDEVIQYGYYGPILEAIMFPESAVKGLLSYSQEHGFLKRGEKKDAEDYFYTALRTQELRASLAISIGKYQQLILGLAEQNTKLRHFYKRGKDPEDIFRQRGEKREESRAYFLGFRLAAY